MKKLTATLALLSILVASTLHAVPCLASTRLEVAVNYQNELLSQEPEPEPETPAKEGDPSEAGCYLRGQAFAQENITGGGNFAGGMVGGLLLGLIGTGIAVLAAGEPPLDPSVMAKAEEEGCGELFQVGYQNKGKSKKQKKALTGGLIGTGILLVILLASNASG